MTFARLRGDNRKGSIMNMSLACRARACPAIAAGCRALRPTARNKASAACPAPSGMKSGRNRCFVDSLRWREVDLNHRFRAWTRFGFGLPDGHRGSHGCGNPRQDRPTQPGATEPRLRQHRPRSAKSLEFCNDLQRWGLGSALLRWLGVARSIFSEPRQLPDSRAAVLAQAKAELARRERERPRARQLYSSRARTRSSNPSPSSGESIANLVTPLSTGRSRRKPPRLGGRKEKAPRKESPGAELSTKQPP